MKKWLALLLAFLMTMTAALAEDVLRVSGSIPAGFQSTMRVEVDSSYLEAEELMSRLESGKMTFDVFHMSSVEADIRDIIDAGYCLDLSGSEVIREAFSRMHPGIAEFLSRGDAIYGIPNSVSCPSQLMCNEEVWRELGYTEADVPQSFPALLDFLETWVVRNENSDLNVRVKGYWDPGEYNAHSYSRWLVDMLMESWLQHIQETGEIVFNTPELVELLERAMAIGEQIVLRCEPVKDIGKSGYQMLFVDNNPFFGGWAMLETWAVGTGIGKGAAPLRGSMRVRAAYAGTEHPEEAIRLLECMLQSEEDWFNQHDHRFLYVDAEPMPNERQAGDLRSDRNRLALIEHRLAGDDAPIEDYLELEDSDYERVKAYDEYTPAWGYQNMKERLQGMTDEEVLQELEEVKRMLAQHEANAWDVSPEDLAIYKQLAQGLVIQEPNFFRNSGGLSQYYNLVKQYGKGEISAQELVTQLDSLVQKSQTKR